MVTHTLVVRLDNAGDVLLTGPAVRAVAASGRVTLLAGPQGAAAARLLPGVDEVLQWDCPWIAPQPAPPVQPAQVEALVAAVRRLRVDRALVFTSFHQSPLPTALVLRLAGVPWIGAISEDYPGSLLDLRHRGVPDDIHEVDRALSLTAAAGLALPDGDDGRLRVRRADRTSAPPRTLPADRPVVALHPGTSVPARAWPPARFVGLTRLLRDRGYGVVVTGTLAERPLTAKVAAGGRGAVDLGGRTTLEELAAVLASADVVVAGNTGPAHLAAAVGTPIVSLFAPTVPASRWRPYGVPCVLLGDQDAVCRDTRVTDCPYPGHPCLSSVTPEDAARAVDQLLDPVQSRHEVLVTKEV